MALGKRLPVLRWSFLRMFLGMKRLLKDWQVGDGREEACARFVFANARPGSIDDAIRAIDEFAYGQKFLINVGDEKGLLLDRALERAHAKVALELGAYVGYSALRIARKLPPGGKLYSIEFNADNADIVRRILAHAGAADRVEVIHGYFGDGGQTLARCKQLIAPGTLDAVFIDHAKDAYVPDLKHILEAGWLHPGSIVVADNIKMPGAPEYAALMKELEGKRFRTVAHETHVEYQTLLKDVVLESTFIA